MGTYKGDIWFPELYIMLSKILNDQQNTTEEMGKEGPFTGWTKLPVEKVSGEQKCYIYFTKTHNSF